MKSLEYLYLLISNQYIGTRHIIDSLRILQAYGIQNHCKSENSKFYRVLTMVYKHTELLGFRTLSIVRILII
jgi:hypothetical protein